MEITSGRLPSERVVLPLDFGKVGLKIDELVHSSTVMLYGQLKNVG